MVANSIVKTVKKHWVLLVLVIAGATLRWVNLSESMTFLYDQGRDALAARGILSGDFVLVGPTTDMPGLFFGPLWYYFLAILYAIASGSPVVVATIVSFLDLATIVLIYFVGRKLFSPITGIVAALFWAFGALPVSYARTLANPATTAFWTLLTIFSLDKLSSGRKIFVIPALFFSAILFQFNAAAAFLFCPVVAISLLFFRKNINWKFLVVGMILGLLTFIPQAWFEIRNSYLGTRSLLQIFANSQAKEGFFFGLFFRWQVLRQELTEYTFFGLPGLSLLLFFVSILFLPRKKLFWLWLTIPIFVYFFLYQRSVSHPFYLLTWIPAVILSLSNFTAILLKKFWPAAFIMVGLFLYLNIPGLHKEIILKDHLAQPADPVKAGLGDQLRVLDYIYSHAGGQDYGYYAYTVTPYWSDQHWQYLFGWYGQKKYHYVPKHESGSPLYIIIEPEPYLGQAFQNDWLKKIHSPANGKVVSSVQIGQYVVEKISK